MALMILGLLVGLLLIWSLGYILVISFGPGVFKPRQIEAASAFMLGLCAAGLLTMVAVRLMPDRAWFHQAVRWTTPFLVMGGGCALILRYHKGLAIFLRNVSNHPFDTGALVRSIFSWSSAVVLLVGAIVLVANKPVIQPTIELYGEQIGDEIHVSVSTTSIQPQTFTIVARSAFGQAVAPVTLEPVSASSGPVKTVIRTASGSRVELYFAADDIARQRPLRSIDLGESRSVER